MIITVRVDKSAGFDRVAVAVGGELGFEIIIAPVEATELAQQLRDVAAKCAPPTSDAPGPK